MQSTTSHRSPATSLEFCPFMTALAIGSLGFVVLMILHPADSPQAMATETWRWVHLGLFVCSILIVFGIFQFAFYMSEPVGTLGLVAFVLLALAAIGLTSITLIEGTIVPVLAANPATAPLLSDNGPLFNGPLGLVFLGSQIGLALGSVLLAWVLVRGKQLPAVPSLLLVAGVLAAFEPPLPHLVGQIGAVVWGVGMAWLSWAVMRMRGAMR